MDQICLDVLRRIVDFLYGEEWANLTCCSPAMSMRVSRLNYNHVYTRHAFLKPIRRPNVIALSIMLTPTKRYNNLSPKVLLDSNPNLKTLNLFWVGRSNVPTITELGVAFSDLTTLVLSSNIYLAPQFFCNLPRSLTRLVASNDQDNQYIESWSDCVASLPRQLEYCQLELFQMDGPSLAHLPQSLIALTLSYYRKKLTDDDLVNLPPNLTSLHIGGVQQFTSRSWKNLPRGLQRLCFGAIMERHLYELMPTNQWLAMPHLSNLVHLDFCRVMLKHEEIEALPSSLTILNMTLDVDHVNHNTFAKLPRSLTSLVMFGAYPYEKADLEQLPNALLKLEVCDGSCVASKTLSPWSYLPPNITNLRIGYGARVSGDDLPNLPKSLFTLDLPSCNSINDENVRFLPRHITHLSVYYNIALTESCLPHLPKNLRILDARFLVGLSPKALFQKLQNLQ